MIFFLAFLVIFLQKVVVQFAYFSMTVECAYCLTFCSDPVIRPLRNNDTNLKKKCKNFLKTMVGTICATFTITGYPSAVYSSA